MEHCFSGVCRVSGHQDLGFPEMVNRIQAVENQSMVYIDARIRKAFFEKERIGAAVIQLSIPRILVDAG
jgi:hypothetical protein